MKKIILLLFFCFFCQNQLYAQFGGGNNPSYNIDVKRTSYFNSTDAHYAGATAKLDIKIGTTENSKSFAPVGTNNPLTQYYEFPLFITGPATRYAKISFNDPNNPFIGYYLYSGYYILPTTIGDHITISELCMIDYDKQFGYGATITLTDTNKYEMLITKFLCNVCIRPNPPCGIATKNTTTPQQPTISLVPNPSIGLSELNYVAIEKENISINVTDLNGKPVKAYTTDVRPGLNKLSIDLQGFLPGTYIVNWKSSNGNNGSLKLLKN